MSGKMLSDTEVAAIKADNHFTLRFSGIEARSFAKRIDRLLAHIEAMQQREQRLVEALERALRAFNPGRVGYMGYAEVYEGRISTKLYDEARAALAAVKEGSE